MQALQASRHGRSARRDNEEEYLKRARRHERSAAIKPGVGPPLETALPPNAANERAVQPSL